MSTLGYIGLFSLVVLIVIMVGFIKDHELGLRRANRRMLELERRINVLVTKTGISTAEMRSVPKQQPQDPNSTFCD